MPILTLNEASGMLETQVVISESDTHVLGSDQCPYKSYTADRTKEHNVDTVSILLTRMIKEGWEISLKLLGDYHFDHHTLQLTDSLTFCGEDVSQINKCWDGVFSVTLMVGRVPVQHTFPVSTIAEMTAKLVPAITLVTESADKVTPLAVIELTRSEVSTGVAFNTTVKAFKRYFLDGVASESWNRDEASIQENINLVDVYRNHFIRVNDPVELSTALIFKGMRASEKEAFHTVNLLRQVEFPCVLVSVAGRFNVISVEDLRKLTEGAVGTSGPV